MTVAGATFVTWRSANGITSVITGGVTLLVVGNGSGVGEVTLAVLVSVPLAGAVTVTVMLVIWLLVNVPSVHHTTVLGELLPPPLALTKVTPAGNVSVTVTLLAPEGPRLVTEME